MGRTEIRGGQIKDDSITGEDVDESTLVLDTLRDADGDTKIQIEESADEDKIRFDTAGVERMIINASGQVGIGTNDPDNTLHIESPGDTHLKIQSENGSYAALKMKSGTGGSTYVWTPADTSDIRLYAGGADRVHVDNDGNVGIGTTDPDYNLHLASAASAVMLIDGADNADAFLRFGQGGTLKSYIKHGSGGHLVMTNETADKDIIFYTKDNTISREGLRLNGNVAEVVVNEGSDSLVDFRVESNSNTHMLYVDGGNNTVGINTSAPGSGLEIAHSISLPTGGAPKTSAYSIAADDFCIVGDCNSSAFTLTLPSATDAMAGRIYTIKRMDSGNSGGGNMLTISRNGKNIDNVAGDVLLANLDALMLQCIGTSGGWIKIGSFVSPI